MNTENYFNTYQNFFLQWAENGEVLTTHSGETVMYRNLLSSLFEVFRNERLPSFHLFCFCWIAFNQRTKEFIPSIIERCGSVYPDELHLSLLQSLDEARPFLKMLSELPEYLQEPLWQKKTMFVLFKDFNEAISATETEKVLKVLRDGKISEQPNPMEQKVLRDTLKGLKILNRTFPDKQSFLQALDGTLKLPLDYFTTENNRIPDEIIEKFWSAHASLERIHPFVKQIQSVHSFTSSVQSSNSPTVGGIAQFSTKGDISKLVLTEWGNEDWMLMHRILNNEALYYQSEEVKSPSNRNIIFLIDTSISSWGTPKLLAISAFLAEAFREKRPYSVLGFGVGDACVPLKFASSGELMDSLSVVSLSLNPFWGLRHFFAYPLPLEKAEVCFISTEEILKSKECKNILSALPPQLNICISASIDGTLRYYQRTREHMQLIKTLQINLEGTPKNSHDKKDPQAHKKKTFPLLLPAPRNFSEMIGLENGDFYLRTNQKILVKSTYNTSGSSSYGCEFVLDNIPNHAEISSEIGIMNNGKRILLMNIRYLKELKCIDIDTGEAQSLTHSFSFTRKDIRPIFHDQTFYIVDVTTLYAVTIEPNFEIKRIQTPFLEDFQDLYKKKSTFLAEHLPRISCSSNIFKNIHTIGLDLEGRLIFNSYTFKYQKNYGIYYEKALVSNYLTVSSRDGNVFKFVRGNQIEVFPFGLLCFRSSEANMPSFYATSMMGVALSFANEYFFAGNKRYRILNSTSTQEIISDETFWESYFLPFCMNLQ